MKPEIYIKKISADRFTPLIVFKKLKGIALLESAILEMGKSRYSIILLEEAFRLLLEKQGVVLEENGKKKLLSKDPQKYFDYLKFYSNAVQEDTRMDFPIPAGGLGYLSYETVRLCDELKLFPQQDVLGIPEAIFSFGAVFAVFDHYKDEINLVVINRDNKVDPQHKVRTIINRLQDYDFRSYQREEENFYCEADLEEGKQDFSAGVDVIKKEIVRGNLLQAVLSRNIKIKTNLGSLEAYSRLRRDNPSPYLFYLDFKDFQLFGSSPEVMVKLQDKIALIKPLAGTRPRGKTVQEDVRLEKELLADSKELAEHLMLIDLARNDLGRIAEPGTVQTTRSFFIERYSHVMHIVSAVQAKLAPQHDVFDLIKASFPAGTVSGAPKLKAMEILSGLEKNKRGHYAGLVGYFDLNGNFDSCITIRSVLYKDGLYHITVGAGIVYDSIAEKEFKETQNKAQAMLNALGVQI